MRLFFRYLVVTDPDGNKQPPKLQVKAEGHNTYGMWDNVPTVELDLRDPKNDPRAATIDIDEGERSS
jgi:hypothetical protein